MVSSSATSVPLPAFLLVLLLLLLSFLNSQCFIVSGELRSVNVAEHASLQIIPKLVVEQSPGLRPGTQVVFERVEIIGMSRFKSLTSFFSSWIVEVIHVNSTDRPSNVAVCFRLNASLALGMYHECRWDKLTERSWVTSMSPFDHNLLDIRITDPFEGIIEVLLTKEFCMYRMVLLVLGITLMTFPSLLTTSLAVYYGGAMTLGVMLVPLVIIFQVIRILPIGGRSLCAIALYAPIVGLEVALLSYMPMLFHSLCVIMGVGEDVYNLGAVSLLAFIVLFGAWFGFWAVRNIALTKDGLINGVLAEYVAMTLQVLGAALVRQVDRSLAIAAVACGILVPSAVKWFLK